MTTQLLERPSTALSFDPLAEAIADAEGFAEPAIDGAVRTKELVIVNWSG
jgi:hypothetical protein